MKYNKKNIMKNAWAIRRNNKVSMSTALRIRKCRGKESQT